MRTPDTRPAEPRWPTSVHRLRRWLAWAVLAVAAVVFALWTDPTVAVVLWITVVVLLALAVLEFLDTGRPAVDAPEARTAVPRLP